MAEVTGGEPGPLLLEERWRTREFSEPARYKGAFSQMAQDREEIDKVEREDWPPPEHYDVLLQALHKKFPAADPVLFGHTMLLVAALMMRRHELRDCGVPDGAGQVKLIASHTKAPPMNMLKDLPAFLGAAKYVRAHVGPKCARVTTPFAPAVEARSGFRSERGAIGNH